MIDQTRFGFTLYDANGATLYTLVPGFDDTEITITGIVERVVIRTNHTDGFAGKLIIIENGVQIDSEFNCLDCLDDAAFMDFSFASNGFPWTMDESWCHISCEFYRGAGKL